MLDGLLKWLGPWLLQRLTKILDPEAAAKAQRLLARNNELDEGEKALAVRETAFNARLVESDKTISDLQQKIAANDVLITDLKNKFAADTQVRKGLEDDLQKKLADIDARPDTDLIDKPLPGTGSKGR